MKFIIAFLFLFSCSSYGALSPLSSATVAGSVAAGDGTVGVPSISFSADTDTGLYRIGANDLGISAAGILGAEFKKSTGNYVNVGLGAAASSSDTSPFYLSRTYVGTWNALFENVDINAGSGNKIILKADAGPSTFEMGLFALLTSAPDAYNGGRATLRCTDSCPGISYIADGAATGSHKFYAGGNGSGDLTMTLAAATGMSVTKTVTAGGTTGNQTINKMAGTVNIATAGTTVTVTNSLVSATSIVFAVVRTNDGTATIKNVVPGSGSFVITLTAGATAETSIGFFVVN